MKKHLYWFLIYGFNIAMVAGLFTLLFTHLLGRVKGAILALVSIVIYTLLVGASPSVVRAALMGDEVIRFYAPFRMGGWN